MGTRAVILVFIASIVVSACAIGGGSAESANITVVPVDADLLAAGRTAYRKYCVQCHGYTGKGDGTSAANLTPPPRDHTNAELMDPISDAVIAQTVVFGGAGRGYPNMPAFPHVEGEELVALVAYVRSLSRPEVQSVDLGDLD